MCLPVLIVNKTKVHGLDLKRYHYWTNMFMPYDTDIYRVDT